MHGWPPPRQSDHEYGWKHLWHGPGRGAYGYGLVFELSLAGDGWIETILYSFCSQADCAAGYLPSPGLIIDESGNLYGTTGAGGSHGHGTVFKLTLGSGTWNVAVLYNFCSVGNCTDGTAPNSGVIMDGMGNLS
jgi:uncharacterized repeat protein (TIGR03803 family)